MNERIPGARETAIAAALAAGRIQRNGIGQARSIRHKGEIDLVTEIDLACEAAVVEIIRERFPTHSILAEEGSAGGDDPRYRWIVDPVDGTTNYAHGFPFFCVSIGLEVDGQLALGAIYDAVRDELFVGESGGGATVNGRALRVSPVEQLSQSLVATGLPYDRTLHAVALAQLTAFSERARAVRRVGSAALELAYVAAGRLDGYWESVTSAWDIAAGLVLVAESGGRATRLDGSPLDVGAGQIVASNGRIHDQMVETLATLNR